MSPSLRGHEPPGHSDCESPGNNMAGESGSGGPIHTSQGSWDRLIIDDTFDKKSVVSENGVAK